MKGLIIKDFLNLRKNFGIVVALYIFYVLLAYKSGDPKMLISIIVLILTMMSITSMALDDLAKWDKYALAMPISRKKLVVSKYILSILLGIIGILFSTPIAYLLIKLNGNISTTELLLTSYLVLIISISFSCIILPLIYKFGVEKSRLLMMVAIGIPVAFVYFINEMGIALPNDNQFIFLLKLSPILLALGIFISINISYGIYKNKDL